MEYNCPTFSILRTGNDIHYFYYTDIGNFIIYYFTLKGTLMGLFMNLLLFNLLYLVIIGIDILCVLLLVRLLCYKWNNKWLTAIDSFGKPLVDWFILKTEPTVKRISKKVYSQQKMLALRLLLLIIIKIILAALFNSIVMQANVLVI